MYRDLSVASSKATTAINEAYEAGYEQALMDSQRPIAALVEVSGLSFEHPGRFAARHHNVIGTARWVDGKSVSKFDQGLQDGRVYLVVYAPEISPRPAEGG